MTDENEQSKALEIMMAALNWAYDRVTGDIPGVGGAEKLAEDHLKSNENDIEKTINELIAWQIGYAGAAGFVTNLGGLLVLPVAVPANLASVLLIQLRMIAAIAHLRGYRIKDEQVRTLAFICLTGSASLDVIKDIGIKFGVKLADRLVGQISRETLVMINRLVGFRLLTKAGSTGVINLGKAVPIVGGLIGGTFDAVVTKGIGAVAKNQFTWCENSAETGSNLSTENFPFPLDASLSPAPFVDRPD